MSCLGARSDTSESNKNQQQAAEVLKWAQHTGMMGPIYCPTTGILSWPCFYATTKVIFWEKLVHDHLAVLVIFLRKLAKLQPELSG